MVSIVSHFDHVDFFQMHLNCFKDICFINILQRFKYYFQRIKCFSQHFKTLYLCNLLHIGLIVKCNSRDFSVSILGYKK
jgi:hypothetical protein